MEEKVVQGYLYDFYGELLNPHQRKLYEDFVLLDLSLGEIALEEGISRQAVHDVIRRSTKMLESYEEKLHLMEKFIFIRERVEEMKELCARGLKEPSPEIMSEIFNISNEILQEL